jgi:hypothetical protein
LKGLYQPIQPRQDARNLFQIVTDPRLQSLCICCHTIVTQRWDFDERQAGRSRSTERVQEHRPQEVRRKGYRTPQRHEARTSLAKDSRSGRRLSRLKETERAPEGRVTACRRTGGPALQPDRRRHLEAAPPRTGGGRHIHLVTLRRELSERAQHRASPLVQAYQNSFRAASEPTTVTDPQKYKEATFRVREMRIKREGV